TVMVTSGTTAPVESTTLPLKVAVDWAACTWAQAPTIAQTAKRVANKRVVKDSERIKLAAAVIMIVPSGIQPSTAGLLSNCKSILNGSAPKQRSLRRRRQPAR